MSIRCVCPNGHVLKVKESLAGTSGLCPTCRARVNVPQRREPPMSEDAILDIMGSEDLPPHTVVAERIDSAEYDRLQEIHGRDIPQKQCYRCKREFPTTIHMCPFCHTYIADLHDF